MSIILRQNKGSELTFAEVDGNFQSLIYSGSLSGNVLTFFYPSSSLSQSFDLNAIAGGVTVKNSGTTVANNVTNLNFLGSAVSSIVSPSQGEVNITLTGGGGSGGSGIFNVTAEYDGTVFATTSSIQVSASAYMSSSYPGTGVTANPNNAGTGGSVLKYGAMFSQSIWHYTDNIGYPTSNQWQNGLDGSFFNRYDANTDTAEILRFIAGLLSASAPDVSENINTWASTDIDFSVGGTTAKSSYMSGVLGGATYRNALLSNNYDSSTRIDLTKTESYRRVQNYLITKGFIVSNETSSNTLHDVGTNPFARNASYNNYGDNFPSTIYNTFGTFTYNADSVAAGSSTVTSSISQSPNKTFGMGSLINSTTVTPYSMSMVGTQSFGNDTGSSTPDENSTFTTSSNNIFIITSENTSGDSNGLFLGILDSGNPQIQNQFQDGKFLNSPGAIAGRKWDASDSDATTGATTASIGYYRLHDLKVGLKTGSQSSFGYNTVNPTNTTVGFYAPTLTTLGVQDITQNDPTPTVNRNVVRTAFTATSRSLSGAPYLLTTTYEYSFSTDAALCFDPCYAYSTAPLATSLTSDAWDTIGTTTLSNTSISVTSAGIQTSTVNGGVYPNGGTPATRRSTNDIPHYNDEAFLSSSFTFTLDSNSNNVVQSKSTMFSQNYGITFRTTARNWKNTATNFNSAEEDFYNAALFGQLTASGSMAVYSRAQGYDAGSETGTTSFSEGFSGENYRLKIDNNALVGTYAGGTKFITASFQTNDEGDNVIGSKDLQVKPGYLVRPNGNYGYWIQDSSPGTYVFYARVFRRDLSSGATSMTLNVGKTLVNWDSTSDGVAAAILFESSGTGTYATPRIYDPTELTSNEIDGSVANDDFKNPFTSNIALYGNTGGGLSSTTYTIPLRSADGMALNATNQSFIVIIRYKGDPTPVTNISVTVS